MPVISRVPDDLTDDDAMRNFYDQLDRKHRKVGNLADLSGSATTTDIVTSLNQLLAIFREQ